MTEPVRLSRRVSDLQACSRRLAELYIEGGWVRVDGVVVELPQFKVLDQQVTLDPEARPDPIPAVTLLLHKPPGHELHTHAGLPHPLLHVGTHWPADHHAPRLLQRHLQAQACATPLESGASGLLVFTQDWRITRKLVHAGALVEHETIVEVRGAVDAERLAQLNRAQAIDGRAMLPARVSISRQSGAITGLRFAVNGHHPGRIAQMCKAAGLTVTAMKRIRIGRIALSALPVGQWRYLAPFERF